MATVYLFGTKFDKLSINRYLGVPSSPIDRKWLDSKKETELPQAVRQAYGVDNQVDRPADRPNDKNPSSNESLSSFAYP